MSSPLVLDGQRSANPARAWCGSSNPELRYLVDRTGEPRLELPRCKRRDCPRCWWLRSRETARCLALDARADMPRYCATLTTVTPWDELEPARVRDGFARVFRAARARHGRVDYWSTVEFTTGRARRARGRRRLHAHLLVKLRDDQAPELAELEDLVRAHWRRAVNAWRVEVAELRSPGAALEYVGLHHRKPSQAPPEGWRGMTERASQGYWSTPIAELRARARAELRAEARAHALGVTRAEEELELELGEPAELRRYRRHYGAALLEPHGAVELAAPRRLHVAEQPARRRPPPA